MEKNGDDLLARYHTLKLIKHGIEEEIMLLSRAQWWAEEEKRWPTSKLHHRGVLFLLI